MTQWQATHKIKMYHDTYLVMLTEEGAAYTASEWRTHSSADFELVDGEWLFQGEAFSGKVTKIEGPLKVWDVMFHDGFMGRRGVVARLPEEAVEIAVAGKDIAAFAMKAEAASPHAPYENRDCRIVDQDLTWVLWRIKYGSKVYWSFCEYTGKQIQTFERKKDAMKAIDEEYRPLKAKPAATGTLTQYMQRQIQKDSGALDGICPGCGADDDALCVCERTFEIVFCGRRKECKGVEVFSEFDPNPHQESVIRKLVLDDWCKYGDVAVHRVS